VTPDDVALAAAVVTSLAYLATAALPNLHNHDRATVLIGVVGAAVVTVVRAALQGTTLTGLLWTVATLNTFILLVTLGRPHLLFDFEITFDEKWFRSGEAYRQEQRRRETLVAYHQVAFVAVLIIGIVLYNVLDLTFLD
jgi:hypothetical protein